MIELRFVEATPIPAIADEAVAYHFKPQNNVYFFTSFKVTKTNKSIFMEIKIKKDSLSQKQANQLHSTLGKRLFCEYYNGEVLTFSDIKSKGIDDICFTLNAISVAQKQLLSLGTLKEVYDKVQVQLSIDALTHFQEQQQKLQQELEGAKKQEIPIPPQKDINKFTKFKRGRKPRHIENSDTLQDNLADEQTNKNTLSKNN